MRETRTVHLVRPGDCNHYGSLFGGTAMAWMDEAAFVAATRYARAKVVTVHADALDFRHPVPQGSIVELVSWVKEVGRSSMRLEVEMWVEPMEREERVLACRAGFVMVVVGPDGRPRPVPEVGWGTRGGSLSRLDSSGLGRLLKARVGTG